MQGVKRVIHELCNLLGLVMHHDSNEYMNIFVLAACVGTNHVDGGYFRYNNATIWIVMHISYYDINTLRGTTTRIA